MTSSAIPALVGALVGGALTIASNLVLEHLRAASKAQQLAHAIAGEALALIEIVETRRYVELVRACADLARKGERQRIEIVAQRNYFPTIEANLDSIGLLPADLPIMVPRLLTFSKSALEDFDRLASINERAFLELDLVRQYEELDFVLMMSLTAARGIVGRVAAIYGSPHYRLPITLKWRMHLRRTWNWILRRKEPNEAAASGSSGEKPLRENS